MTPRVVRWALVILLLVLPMIGQHRRQTGAPRHHGLDPIATTTAAPPVSGAGVFDPGVFDPGVLDVGD